MSALSAVAPSDDEVLVLLRRLTAAVETLVIVAQGRPKPTEQDTIAALLIVGPSIPEIAKRTGFHKSSLYRMKRFMTFYRRAQQPDRLPPRGFRTTEGIEAAASPHEEDHDDE